ncbi:hypothetical protein EYF80_013610 [Liparis tanakae]|uniref:Secreted protein n=1 Tax=Liparis tanakae TaxID=230148 RepID=A0A4Z2IDB6_9TELE|nr:hypothetical protein EYF80_013610 [Liparis tanakae]
MGCLKPSLAVVCWISFSSHVLDELGHPPNGGVAVQAVQARGQVLRDRQGQVGGPRVETVHYRQLHNLDVLIVGLSWMDRRGEELSLFDRAGEVGQELFHAAH